MEISNNGNFKWYVENLIHDNSNLNIILISDSFINCRIDSRIEQTHLISFSFKLFPLDTQFNWIWSNEDFTIVNPGKIYNIIDDGFYHQDRVSYKLSILASINNIWIQRNYDDLSTQELLSEPNWIDFNFYLNNANSTHNHNSH